MLKQRRKSLILKKERGPTLRRPPAASSRPWETSNGGPLPVLRSVGNGKQLREASTYVAPHNFMAAGLVASLLAPVCFRCLS